MNRVSVTTKSNNKCTKIVQCIFVYTYASITVQVLTKRLQLGLYLISCLRSSAYQSAFLRRRLERCTRTSAHRTGIEHKHLRGKSRLHASLFAPSPCRSLSQIVIPVGAFLFLPLEYLLLSDFERIILIPDQRVDPTAASCAVCIYSVGVILTSQWFQALLSGLYS